MLFVVETLVKYPKSFVEASQKGEAPIAEQKDKREAIEAKRTSRWMSAVNERGGILSDTWLAREKARVSRVSAIYCIILTELGMWSRTCLIFSKDVREIEPSVAPCKGWKFFVQLIPDRWKTHSRESLEKTPIFHPLPWDERFMRREALQSTEQGKEGSETYYISFFAPAHCWCFHCQNPTSQEPFFVIQTKLRNFSEKLDGCLIWNSNW